MNTLASVAAELRAIADRFDAADKRLLEASVYADEAGKALAEQDRRQAMAEHWEASEALADLFLLMLRHAAQHRRDAIRAYLDSLNIPPAPLPDPRTLTADQLPEWWLRFRKEVAGEETP